jgi:preprotein translocase subunit YajC
MIVLKGDIVRTESGIKGEVMDVWGVARTWLRIQSDSGKHYALESDVSEVIKRPKRKSPRERR